MNRLILTAIAALFANNVAEAAPQLNAATLPNSRAVAVNSPATIFASVINSGDTTATNCRVALGFGANPSLSVSYSPADGGGAINGAANTPVSINAGATQQFVIAVTSSAPFNGSVPLTYVCDNGQAISATGLNDLALLASATATPDVIAIAATLTSDGIMQTNVNGRGIMSMSAINIGSAGTPPPADVASPAANEATITVNASITNFTDAGEDYTVTVCPSNASAVCTSPFASSVQAQIGDAPVFFNVALQHPTNVGIPFFPGELRLRVEFRDQSNNLVGATSIAPRSASPTVSEQLPHGFWDMFVRDDSDPGGSFTRVGRLFFPPDGSTPAGGILRQGGSGSYIQTIVLDGDLDFSNGSRFLGCVRFLNSGNNDAAYPDVNLRFVPRHFLRATYASGGANACPPGANSAISAPSIDPVTSSGLMFGGFVELEEDDGEDPPALNWTIRNPIDENDTYGTATSTLTLPGVWNVSGTYRGCNISGTLSKYTTSSPVLGARLALRADYNFTNCPNSSPQTSWNNLRLQGFLAIGQGDDGSNDVEGLGTIFTDGFESGDTSAWIAVIP